ncbi:MAG: F0F1-type ATP synthase delta subunit [Planctomycetota bacterium]|jgi:F0F1-type ATP synthase delta subunit
MNKIEHKIARSLYKHTKNMSTAQASQLIDEVATALTAEGKASLLLGVVSYLEKIRVEESAFESLSIETPYELSPDLITGIQEVLHANAETPLHMTIDSSLIGGYRATYRGIIVDASLKSYLERLEKQFIN